MLNDVERWLELAIGISVQTQSKLLSTLATVGVLWLVRRLILSLVDRRVEDLFLRYRWQKTTRYVIMPLGLLIVGRIWFDAFSDIATYLGLVSAGVAISLKDLLANLAGWAFILTRRPFEVGDRIEIGQNRGDVIDVRIFEFTLMEVGNWVNADQSTGRIIHIPNGRVLNLPVANYTAGFSYIWNELQVLVTFESDWRKAKALLSDIAARHSAHLSAAADKRLKEVSRRFLIYYSVLTPTVYTSVSESGVLLTARYLCEPRNRRGSAQVIWEEILDAFHAAPEIDFAYPTVRYMDNSREGKPPLRPDGVFGDPKG